MSSTLISLSNKLINFFFIFLTIISILNGIKLNNSEKKQFEYFKNIKETLPELRVKKDIIWILLDEYAAPSSLRSQFYFKDWLVDSLEKRKFFIFDSLPSRYDVTIWSINSIFNLDYTIVPKNFMFAAKYLTQIKWVKSLQKQGYLFNNFDFLSIADSKGISKVSYYFFPTDYSQQILYNSIFFSAWYYIIEPKEKIIDNYNQKIIKEATEILKERRNSIQFTWIHLLIPHPPYYKDAKGKINKDPVVNPNRRSQEEAKKQYINFLSYGNKIILNLLNQIPEWEKKTIIISGDHGARMYLSHEDPRRFATFAAIYYPKMDTSELKQIKYLQQIPFYLH